MEHAKLKSEKEKSEVKARIDDELEVIKQSKRIQEQDLFESEKKKRSQLQILRKAIVEQQMHKNRVLA